MPSTKTLIPLIVVGGISAIISFFASDYLFANKNSLTAKVEVVDTVSSDFDYIGKPYFTTNAINPTKDIQINENNNPNLFN
jgi:hypothetical protein